MRIAILNTMWEQVGLEVHPFLRVRQETRMFQVPDWAGREHPVCIQAEPVPGRLEMYYLPRQILICPPIS